MSFLGELRRRNVFRVGIAYLAAVWVLIEVVDTIVSIINTRSSRGDRRTIRRDRW